VQPSQLTGRGRIVSRLEGDVEAPLVADLHRDLRRLHPPQHLDALGDGGGQRRLTEQREPSVDGGDNQLRVGVGAGGDEDTVDARLQQRVGRIGGLGAEPVGDLGGEERDGVGDDQRVHHRQGGEGLGVERTDPAQPDQAKTHGGEPPLSPGRRRRSGPSR
jgi:hypothetical protein